MNNMVLLWLGFGLNFTNVVLFYFGLLPTPEVAITSAFLCVVLLLTALWVWCDDHLT